MNLSSKIKALLTAFICLLATAITAQLKIAEAFSNNMVLQRDKPLTIWGSSIAGTQVIVQFATKQKETFTDSAGKWAIVFEPLAMSATPQNLTVVSGNLPTLTLKNILVGDVWLCGGQSNMEYPLDRKMKRYAAPKKGIDEAEAALTESKPDAIRYLYVEKDLKKNPVLPTKGWTDGNDTLVRYASAIGYFFAKDIYQKTKVPIGIITSSWGGTRIEQWQPEWSYENSKAFKDSITSPNFKIDGIHPGQMYKGLIEPLIPFAIKGVLWYQGESNAMVEDQKTYPLKFELLLNTWRNLFKDASLPFYYVQIAPYLYTVRKDKKIHSSQLLPEFWEAQTKSLLLKNVGMVVTTDLVDNLADIHPSYKWTVGRRLALVALEKTYGQKQMAWSGPQYASAKRKQNSIVLSFHHKGTGLASSDGNALTWFSIAGKDGKFVPATAVIVADKVIVSSGEIEKPRYVRFAWDEKAQPNFISREGLSALPFRTGL
ncbi:sialate O-acetylesterase [Ferruginibacter sp.]|nr:sialate O-acetylesterase [Ferruginibacter sp.]